MFGKGKPRADRKNRDLSQFGLFDVPSDINTDGGMDFEGGDDSDLEAELLALAGEDNSASNKPKRKPKQAVPQGELDSMVSESLRNIPSDDDVSVDENDPELLSELNEIAGVDPEPVPQSPPVVQQSGTNDMLSLLEKRFEMYQLAEKNAKEVGESSRARRYGRAINTLKDLIKQAKAGRPIDESIIPPEVATSLKKRTENEGENVSSPTRPAPAVPTSPESVPTEPNTSEDAESAKLLAVLAERNSQYKVAALKAKRSGDTKTAMHYIKIAKQFELVIDAVNNGQAIDLSNMPGPPGSESTKPEVEHNQVQQGGDPEQPSNEDGADEGLITASSVAEALEQRIEFFKKQEQTAKDQGNSSKARRLGRVIKQFQDALKLHKAGKPFSTEDLPVPPGYAPIPINTEAPSPASPPPQPKPRPQPAAVSTPSPQSSGSEKSAGGRDGRYEKQIQILQKRQKEFKEAALNAKKKGEINEAKEYLKQAMGFEKLIQTARGGLPIDFSSLPLSPAAKSQLDEEYDIVKVEEALDDDDDSDLISRLEAQLTKQLKLCLTNRDHNKTIGDVAGANRFERLALNVTKDLDVVRLAHKTGGPIPKFHYETKEFSIVKSFTELNDNDLELSILRGINYNCDNPKDIDTYVKYEFPYPQDDHYVDKTATVKNTNNPEYNTTVIIPIQRAQRTCQRVFKRHSLKLEVYSKAGWFRSDTLIGTAQVKLSPLEAQCEIHDSFDLLEGRRKTGGKIEVKIRIRQPISTQQVEQIREKWLVIDS